MGFATNDTASSDPVFRQQVRQSCMAQASVVGAEASGTTNHANRSAFATSIVSQCSDDRLTSICRFAVSDNTTAPGASDGTVLARIASIWNSLAGGL